jgi:hypothetical protein
MLAVGRCESIEPVKLGGLVRFELIGLGRPVNAGSLTLITAIIVEMVTYFHIECCPCIITVGACFCFLEDALALVSSPRDPTPANLLNLYNSAGRQDSMNWDLVG